ncbi:50S ribosomal protein L25 [Candidatus Peregrinibacteria bacterium]|nr:50S ribosomal protein L25 [Candidatus Peregrinibacteria bacterium]
METIKLDVTQGVYDSAKAARAAKRVPMVYYGKGVENTNFSADYQAFRRAYKTAGKSTIIMLVNEKKEEFPVLVHEMQYHPVTDEIWHVDLVAVDMNKPITTSIPFKFAGIAPAVKELGGTFVHSKDSIRVECLPKDLIHELEVDIAGLADFHSQIKVKDIKVPAGYKVLDNPEINVCTVTAPRKEEEIAVAAAVPEGGAAPAEGTAPAAGAKKEEAAAPEKKGKK